MFIVDVNVSACHQIAKFFLAPQHILYDSYLTKPIDRRREVLQTKSMRKSTEQNESGNNNTREIDSEEGRVHVGGSL